MKVDPASLNDLLNKLVIINNKHYPNPKKKEGDIGERFVKESIKYYMWEKGFKLRSTGNRTFKIRGQYKAGKGGMGGIDFRFGFVHNNRRYDCYVETKNWNVYSIAPTTFQTEILDRYYNNANQPGCIWVLTINQGYVYTPVGVLCSRNNIHIVPIDRKITPGQLNAKSLRIIMEHFLDDFDKFMKRITKVKISKARKIKTQNPKPYDEAIILGLPPSFIAKKYGTTTSNIYKRKSQLKKQGIKLLDGRSRLNRLMKFLDKQQIENMYKIMIKMIMEDQKKR